MIALDVQGSDIDLSQLFSPEALNGRIDGEIKASLRGVDQDAWRRTAQGSVRLALSKAAFEKVRPEEWIDGVTPLAKLARIKDERLEVQCALVELNIEDGQAISNLLVADLADATLIGEGRLDLGRESAAVLIEPRSKGAAVQAGGPMRIEGNWQSLGATATNDGVASNALVLPPRLVGALNQLGYADGEIGRAHV